MGFQEKKRIRIESFTSSQALEQESKLLDLGNALFSHLSSILNLKIEKIPPILKNSDLTLSPKRGILAQARISQSQNAISCPGETTLVHGRILQYSPGFHPPRPRSSKYKQGESTSKSNPLKLTRLLANDAQRKVFDENFHARAIFSPKYGNIGNFEFEDFLFPYLLRQQKLFDFCCEANDIYPELVRVFYYNMNFRKNLMTSHVKGKDIVLDMQTFSSICCDIPMIGDITGFGLVCEWDDYDRKKFYLSICRISKEEIERRKQQSLGRDS
ncbi:hypothetical protein Lal_00039348 [Lupinus albus]|nr:hypothetical protein Lal_00039348 [Lupinus albus]